MSGGHWNYEGMAAEDHLRIVGDDPAVQRRWPRIAAAYLAAADLVAAVEREMDYDLSCDASIPDDEAFDRAAFAAVLDALLKAAPDAWFPRGKWATIQAIQAKATALGRRLTGSTVSSVARRGSA